MPKAAVKKDPNRDPWGVHSSPAPEAVKNTKGVPSQGSTTLDRNPPPSDDQRVQELLLAAEAEDNDPVRAQMLEQAAEIVSRWPEDKQEELYHQLDTMWGGTGGNFAGGADALQSHVQKIRQTAFRNGEILPGVDSAGGGTGLSPNQVQSILTGNQMDKAEGIRSDLEGLGVEDYTYDPAMDKGPGYSLLGKMRGEGAFHDTTVDPYEAALEEAIAQERSDTTGVDAQKRSLSAYDDIISDEGLTAIDRARIEEMRRDTARRARGQEGAILADMAERGRSSGIASSLLRQQAQQAATNEQAMGDMRTAALGLERKDQAIRNRGFLGGDVQAGVDSIDRFNTQNRQDVQLRNTDRTNKAGTAAWDLERQREDQNVITTQNAIGGDFDADTRRSERNTDRTNEASQFNVGPGQGKRGMIGDRLDAHEAVVNTMTKGPGFDPDAPQAPEEQSDPFGATAGGAMSGGKAGSAAGPWGAVVGAGAGGGLGLLGELNKPKRRARNGSW